MEKSGIMNFLKTDKELQDMRKDGKNLKLRSLFRLSIMMNTMGRVVIRRQLENC